MKRHLRLEEGYPNLLAFAVQTHIFQSIHMHFVNNYWLDEITDMKQLLVSEIDRVKSR